MSDMLLTEQEAALIEAVRSGDRAAADVRLATVVAPAQTYENRAALYILGYLSIVGVLNDELIDSPHENGVGVLADRLGEALLEALHVLGCPRELTLAQILDRASSYPTEKGGAK